MFLILEIAIVGAKNPNLLFKRWIQKQNHFWDQNSSFYGAKS